MKIDLLGGPKGTRSNQTLFKGSPGVYFPFPLSWLWLYSQL